MAALTVQENNKRKTSASIIPFVKISFISLNIAVCLNSVHAAIIGSQIGNNILINDGDKIIADKGNAQSLYGVMNTGTGVINLGNGASVNVNVISPLPQYYSTNGIFIQGDNSNLIANKLSVEVSGESSIGLDLSGNCVKANLGTGSSISVEGKNGISIGAIVNNGSSLKADNFLIQTKGDRGAGFRVDSGGSSADLGHKSKIITSGDNNYGLFISTNTGNANSPSAYFKANELNIDTAGFGSYGINSQPNTTLDLGTGSRIKTGGQYATGIWSFGNLKAESLVIDILGDNSNGLEALGGTVNIGADSHISTTSGGALISANNGTTVNYSGTANNRNSLSTGGGFGVSSHNLGSTVNLKNTNIMINKPGKNPYGIWAHQGGVINGENININSVSGTQGVYAMNGGQINLSGNLVIKMAAVDQIAIATKNNDNSSPSKINASGKMLINGSITSSGGLININMLNGSLWSGNAYSDNYNYLNINMDNSRWTVTGNSNLDNLSLKNSVVDLTNPLRSDSYTALKVKNLEGNGNFILRTDIAGEGHGVKNAGDKLIVTGASTGNHLLTIMNHGSMNTNGKEVLTVVETVDGIANFSTTSSIELGGYLYDLRKKGNNWELASSGTPTPTPTPTPDNNASVLTSTANASSNFLNISYMLNFVDIQTLMQRLGDLRQSTKQGNAWVKELGGKIDGFRNGKQSFFDMTYSGTQFGFDKRISSETPLYLGTFMELTRGSPRYRDGNGVVQNHRWGVYSTIMAENGFYIDSSISLSRLKNSFRVTDTQNNKVMASTSSSGVTASVETGNRINLSMATDGFYIEPQGQFTYIHQNAAKFLATNGLTSKLGSYESKIGRVGMLLGYEKKDGNNKVNFYLKSGFIKEFGGNTGYKLNESSEKHIFKSNWWNNGFGISVNVNHAHSVYLEADSTKGRSFHQQQVNGGYRFTF